MRQLMFLGVLVALLGACKKDENDRDETCDPADNPGCTLGECLFGSECYENVFECQDGVWVDIGDCDVAPSDAGPYPGPDARPYPGPDAGPDTGMDGAVPDAGPGAIPDAGAATDATVL